MAKKKPGFNMAEEIRSLLTSNSKMSGREVQEALQKKYPKAKLNAASVGVAFSNARKKLGISRSVKRKKPGRGGRAGSGAVGGGVSLDMLQAAKAYLAKCDGDEAAAISAIRQLSSLQIS